MIQMIKEWIKNNLITADLDNTTVIVFNLETYTISVEMDAFIDFFGEVIQTALDNGEDVIQAIKDSDPNNELGYNDII